MKTNALANAIIANQSYLDAIEDLKVQCGLIVEEALRKLAEERNVHYKLDNVWQIFLYLGNKHTEYTASLHLKLEFARVIDYATCLVLNEFIEKALCESLGARYEPVEHPNDYVEMYRYNNKVLAVNVRRYREDEDNGHLTG